MAHVEEIGEEADQAEQREGHEGRDYANGNGQGGYGQQACGGGEVA
ncbi:MAG: hypothetical protein ABSG69_15330 [Candidatus Acidiferrum sp.]